MSAPWEPNGAPFCWLPKEGLRLIEERLEESEAMTAKAVYLALCRLASDVGNNAFDRSISFLATLASCSRRTVERRLPDLARLGLVQISPRRVEGTKGKDTHHYELATLRRKVATQSHNLATQRSLQRVASNSKRTREGEKEATADRISRERRLAHLRDQLRRHREVDQPFRDDAWLQKYVRLQREIEKWP